MKHIKLFEQFINGDAINEYDTRNFKPADLDSKSLKGAEKWLKKYMTRTAKTIDEATKRIESFAGGTMFTHVQYHEVMPNGNMPNRPKFRLHQSQEWLNDAQLTWMNRKGESVNATLLTIYDITNDTDTKIGRIYVATDAFLDELGRTFQIIKTAS